MKINIYYGGRGLLDDPTLYVISRIENVLKELRVKVERYNIYEHKNEIATLPQTFKDVDGIKAHMAKHAALIRPKFELVENILTDEIASRGIGTWVKQLGGYFFGFEALSGCAKEIVAKCKEAGVTMTGAGSPFPYKKDPDDSVIRIAPTYPSLDELKKAAEVFVVVTRLVSVNKLLEA